jgi:hypothetical protein
MLRIIPRCNPAPLLVARKKKLESIGLYASSYDRERSFL